MVFSKLLFKKEKRKEEEEEAPPPDVRGFTVAEIWELKLRLHEATRDLDQQAWTQRFHLADRRSEGALSFDDFRRTVRSANVKASVISDVDLKSVVTIVDADGSGKIDLEEFLTFLRPDFIPDMKARASSFEGAHRDPMHTVNGQGTSMNKMGCLVHTGEINGNAWCSEDGVDGNDTYIEFEFPKAYFIKQICIWNFMSWLDTKADDCLCSLSAFEISYSLNGRHWYHMGRVADLPEIPSTGIFSYTGELIQNRSLGGKAAMPSSHRKAGLVQVDEVLGAPVRFLRFHHLENRGGPKFGLNGAFFYGPEAVGDCVQQNMGLLAVPSEVYGHFQYVVGLDLSHNKIASIPQELDRMVLCKRLNLSYNLLEEFPQVITQGDFPNTLRTLDLSHNLLVSIPPEVANLVNLEELLLAGHFWDPKGGVTKAICKLLKLKTLDLTGLPTVPEWLWLAEPRERHGLDQHADHSVIDEKQFLAYIEEHPLLRKTFGIPGARAMFYRYDSNKTVTLDKTYVPVLDLQEAEALDGMMAQIFSKDYSALPDGIWDMPALKDLRLYRSGISKGGQKLPSWGLAEKVSDAAKLGIFTLLGDQAACFKGAIHLEVPNIMGVLEEEKKERALEERGMLDPLIRHFDATAGEAEMSEALKEELRLFRHATNPALPSDSPVSYIDYRGVRQMRGGDVYKRTIPTFRYGAR